MLDRTIAYDLEFLFPAKDEAVGACLRRHGEFARVELDLLLDLATGPGTYIDVGANIGAIALPFAKQRPDWRVLAIEAHRGLSGVLWTNAMINRLYNVDVHHAAAGAARGLAEFPALALSSRTNFGAVGFKSTTGATETVRMLALDDVAPDDTRLVKIDVEGFEPEVLKGADALLNSHRAAWIVEATIQNPEAAIEVINCFRQKGYSLHWLFAPFATPKSEKDRPTTPMMGDANIVALPRGVTSPWPMTAVDDKNRRPESLSAYPYLLRYGYA